MKRCRLYGAFCSETNSEYRYTGIRTDYILYNWTVITVYATRLDSTKFIPIISYKDNKNKFSLHKEKRKKSTYLFILFSPGYIQKSKSCDVNPDLTLAIYNLYRSGSTSNYSHLQPLRSGSDPAIYKLYRAGSNPVIYNLYRSGSNHRHL